MIEVVGNYVHNLKPLSYHELIVPLLKNELELIKTKLQGSVIEQTQFGCSIMSDAWSNRNSRTLINFMVNTPSGSYKASVITKFIITIYL